MSEPDTRPSWLGRFDRWSPGALFWTWASHGMLLLAGGIGAWALGSAIDRLRIEAPELLEPFSNLGIDHMPAIAPYSLMAGLVVLVAASWFRWAPARGGWWVMMACSLLHLLALPGILILALVTDHPLAGTTPAMVIANCLATAAAELLLLTMTRSLSRMRPAALRDDSSDSSITE